MTDFDWQKWNDFERKVVIDPGYDCRMQCEHEKKADHGCCGDYWGFLLRRDGCTLTLTVRADTVRGKRIPPPPWPIPHKYEVRPTEGTDLTLWTPWPVNEDQVLTGPDEDETWVAASTCIGAEQLWKQAVDVDNFDDLYMNEETLLSLDKVWEELAARFNIWLHDARQQRTSKIRCPRCDGKGIVEP